MTRQVHVVEGRGGPLSAVPRDEKVALLREHGAALFRGFRVATDDFVELAHELGRSFYNMSLDPRIREMVTPDGVVAGVLKGQGRLPLHMERGYSPLKPELVLFHVVEPSPAGGESLLCSGARVIELMPDALLDRFRRKRLKYRHQWEPQAWQGRYGKTPDHVSALMDARDDVLEHHFEGDILHYTYVTSALQASRHAPGQLGFVNNLEGAWEVQHAPAATRRAVYEHSVCFEDDEPMTQEIIDAVRAAVAEATEVFPLAPGDVIALDNYRFMHGRNPFEGRRVMHTIMADAGF